MKMYLKATAAIILGLALLASSAPAWAVSTLRSDFEERRRSLAALMEAATVWIVTEDDEGVGSGTGFIVGDGYIVTNAHVVSDLGRGGTVYVLNERISARKASLVKTLYDSPTGWQPGGRDFALLRFDPPKGVPVLAINTEVRRMDRVSAWGYPRMATQFDVNTERLRRGDTRDLKPPPVVFTEGSVNTIIKAKLGEAILHSAQISRGNSGGPLVNSRGEVVGVNTWRYRAEDEGDFLNGAQPANELAWFLTENGVTPKLAEGQQLAPPPARDDPSWKLGKLKSAPAQEEKEDRRRDVGSFSALVPPGWSVLEEEEDSLLLISDDQEAVVGILVYDSEGRSLSQSAKDLSENYGGTEPEVDDDVYIFSFSDDGVDTMVFIGEAKAEGRLTMIFISGEKEKPGLEEILNSLEDK